MTPPITITCGNRQSIINGTRVSLLKLRNKKRAEGVWPETMVADPVARMYAAWSWAMKGIIDDDFVGVTRGRC